MQNLHPEPIPCDPSSSISRTTIIFPPSRPISRSKPQASHLHLPHAASPPSSAISPFQPLHQISPSPTTLSILQGWCWWVLLKLLPFVGRTEER
ncbi:hypothetical protein MRB53_020358 [Persea americana]|uniref:Uncharacterized protein n=1 Tax=Persea americana TaxID=3435 RepID=A0ACC2L1M7_PERAE|nr:hypothetical protein MRB53_020358 [Persea americana]